MTSLLTVQSVSKAHGTTVLFKNITFSIGPGDRIGMIGPNGGGKSSLIKIVAGIEEPDSGSIVKKQNLRVGYSSQSPQFPSLQIEQFLIKQIQIPESEARTKANILLGKAGFTDFTEDASKLSGGWKKRLDILRALMNDPDILLLDEPTNHLDLHGILWLETFLKKLTIPYLVVSHDRYFLENVTNKMIEINSCYPEGLIQFAGNMSAFMSQKEAFLQAQEKKERSLTQKVRGEIDWLRTSPKARTTKSQARIQQAYSLIDELSDTKQRNKTQKADISFTASERQTTKLLVAKNISKTLSGRELFHHIDLTLTPETRLGIVGKNGTGKTTLLKILAGMTPPDTGTIKYADQLKIVYFDQQREHLPDHLTLKEAFNPHGDMVDYRGQKIHVHGWAKRFLFSPDRLNLPIRYLSGGEKARVIIAKFMLEPADLLFLDEPTNDLDIPTLEVIEESLLSFSGAIVLISHDRCMMDRICTQILGLGENNEHQFFADYEQWEKSCLNADKKEKPKNPLPLPISSPKEKNKLSYKEKVELENMENLILETEEKIELLQEKLKEPENALELYHLLAEAHKNLDSYYRRWQELIDKN